MAHKYLCSLFVILGVLLCVTAYKSDNFLRIKRSLFKKHRIEYDETEPVPTPPPIVEEHHYHHHYPPPPTPSSPPPYKHESVHIEFNKGKWKGDKGEKEDEIKKAIEEAKIAAEREKQEKLDKWKDETEEKLAILAKIPEKFASDLDWIGRKIEEDLEKKKDIDKGKGISIEIWKNKGKGGGNRRKGESSEEVHHHHHYYGSSEETYKQPPKKSYEEDGYYETINKFADLGTQFMTYLEAANNQYRRPPPTESEESESNESYGKGKGFQFNLWKNKGRRRR